MLDQSILDDAPLQTQGVSIAVLPFVNMSNDADQEYFSDGVSEELLNLLAKIPEFRVAGRTSSFAYKGHNQNLREIGQSLGSAQARPQSQFGIDNAEAYNAYLKGLFFYNKSGTDNLDKATQHMQEAVTLAPESALVFDTELPEAHLADAGIKYNWDWDWAGADEALNRALELRPGYLDAQLLQASYGDLAAYQQAVIFAFWGDSDMALDWLERSYNQRDPGILNIKPEQMFTTLRGHPRFESILQKMNLNE